MPISSPAYFQILSPEQSGSNLISGPTQQAMQNQRLLAQAQQIQNAIAQQGIPYGSQLYQNTAQSAGAPYMNAQVAQNNYNLNRATMLYGMQNRGGNQNGLQFPGPLGMGNNAQGAPMGGNGGGQPMPPPMNGGQSQPIAGGAANNSPNPYGLPPQDPNQGLADMNNTSLPPVNPNNPNIMAANNLPGAGVMLPTTQGQNATGLTTAQQLAQRESEVQKNLQYDVNPTLRAMDTATLNSIHSNPLYQTSTNLSRQNLGNTNAQYQAAQKGVPYAQEAIQQLKSMSSAPFYAAAADVPDKAISAFSQGWGTLGNDFNTVSALAKQVMGANYDTSRLDPRNTPNRDTLLKNYHNFLQQAMATQGNQQNVQNQYATAGSAQNFQPQGANLGQPSQPTGQSAPPQAAIAQGQNVHVMDPNGGTHWATPAQAQRFLAEVKGARKIP